MRGCKVKINGCFRASWIGRGPNAMLDEEGSESMLNEKGSEGMLFGEGTECMLYARGRWHAECLLAKE